MANVRLTKFQRDTIVSQAITARFDPPKEALRLEEAAMGLALYEKVFSASERAKVNALPDRWKRMSKTVKFNLNGMVAEFGLVDALPVPRHEDSYYPVHAFPEPEIQEAFLALRDRIKELKSERDKARNVLAAFIATFSTTKQLHEAWPEGLAFYANIVVEPVNLPALQTVEINKMLGLGLAA